MRLRQWRDEDVEHLARLSDDERFMRYLGPKVDPAAQLARYRALWERHGFGIWALEERDSGRFAGRTGLHFHSLWPDDVEVGWSIDPELWGQGYATEAGAASMRHAFVVVGAPRVVSIIHPENLPSIRVAEKLGERPYANVRWDPPGIDLLVYSTVAPTS